jgi:hypothetical protein
MRRVISLNPYSSESSVRRQPRRESVCATCAVVSWAVALPNGRNGDDEQVDEEQPFEGDLEDDVNEEELDLSPLPSPGLCGFGAMPAVLASLVSLGGARRVCGRRRR